MPRPKRDIYEGVFHVTSHSVRDEALFRRELDRIVFLRQLARATAKTGWTCVAYCLMQTHFHLMLAVAEGAMPKGMHSLNFRYACWFNQTYGCRGHVLGSRYWSRRIGDDSGLLEAYRYIANNPVRAGICRAAEDWQWSSFAGAVGLAEPATFVDASMVLGLFDRPGQAASDLRRFVAARLE